MAYIRTDEVAAIRGQLKEAFPQLKFSVRKQHHSSVIVTIKSGTVDFSDVLDENGYCQTNQYWLDRMGQHKELFEEIYKIVKTAPGTVEGGREWFDDSDSMTDYFHTAFFMSVNIGSWHKPYVLAKAPRKPARKPRAQKVAKTTDINPTVEVLARMTGNELNTFVDSLMDRFPTLGENIMSQIGYALLEKDHAEV